MNYKNMNYLTLMVVFCATINSSIIYTMFNPRYKTTMNVNIPDEASLIRIILCSVLLDNSPQPRQIGSRTKGTFVPEELAHTTPNHIPQFNSPSRSIRKTGNLHQPQGRR